MPILHHHMFESAGTAVDAVLEAKFASRWGNHDTPDPASSVAIERLGGCGV
jgi:hypothetical protein